MKNQLSNEFVVENLVDKITDSIYSLSSLWDKLSDEQKAALETKFPFPKSLDEVANDCVDWAAEVRGQLLGGGQ